MDIQVPYIRHKRKYGEGEFRLGKVVQLDPSIYSYSYAMYIKNESITEFMDILTGKVNFKEANENDVVENKVMEFLESRLINEGISETSSIEDDDFQDKDKDKDEDY